MSQLIVETGPRSDDELVVLEDPDRDEVDPQRTTGLVDDGPEQLFAVM